MGWFEFFYYPVLHYQLIQEFQPKDIREPIYKPIRHSNQVVFYLQQLNKLEPQHQLVRRNCPDEVNDEYDPKGIIFRVRNNNKTLQHTTGNWRPAFDERVFDFVRAFPLPATFPRPDIVFGLICNDNSYLSCKFLYRSLTCNFFHFYSLILTNHFKDILSVDIMCTKVIASHHEISFSFVL